jgi:hypothetical protein
LKNILILYPHFPPSNLAGVHRPRLFAQHFPEFGWNPIILTVHEDYYEESLDWNLHKLLPAELRIEKVKAFKITKPRFIGDIGLRAFFQLYRHAKQLLQSENIDFLYIPIPSFYCALLGRMLHERTGIKYGIDYIDPWVHDFPGSNKIFSRHWFSKQLAKFLEPIAVKKASLITGVAEGYYQPVLERNPGLKTNAISGAMPYGGEQADHDKLDEMDIKPYLFQSKPGIIQLIYAGAMLPKSYQPLEAVLKAISANRKAFENVEFHFVGTGSIANDAESFNIKPLAEKYGLYDTIIFEYPKRIPYLDVLVHLNASDGVFVLGSTEPHYTPSKVYQAVLAKKPVLALLHRNSTAIEMLIESNAGLVLAFDGENGMKHIEADFKDIFIQYKSMINTFKPEHIDYYTFNLYSAKNVTKTFAELLTKVTK